MRAFIGLAVPEEALPALGRVQGALEVGRAVDPENWHVTLAFLGDVAEPELEEVHAALSEIEAPCFDVAVKGIDVLGAQAPVALVAAVEAVPELVALRRAVRSAVHRAGVELPRARFRPHITLARFKKRLGALDTQRIASVLEAYGDLDAGRLGVSEVTLYRSHLGPDGVRYEVLAEYPLRR